MIAERISAQMNEIGKTPMSGITLEILRKVCFADVCGIRLSTRKLLRELSKNISYDIGEILKSMSDEFLVHVSEDGDYVNTCKKEINEVNSLLEPIQQGFPFVLSYLGISLR